jgi:hypothetical protein
MPIIDHRAITEDYEHMLDALQDATEQRAYWRAAENDELYRNWSRTHSTLTDTIRIIRDIAARHNWSGFGN